MSDKGWFSEAELGWIRVRVKNQTYPQPWLCGIPKKSRPLLYSDSRYKNKQYHLDIQYSLFSVVEQTPAITFFIYPKPIFFVRI